MTVLSLIGRAASEGFQSLGVHFATITYDTAALTDWLTDHLSGTGPGPEAPR